MTLGIYDLVCLNHVRKEINTILGDADKKVPPFWIAWIFGWITLGIVPLVWACNVATRLGLLQEAMISASHNPYSDNGIKIFNNLGEKLCDEVEELIETYMDQKEDDLPLKQGELVHDPSLKESYIAWLASKADPAIKGSRLLVDCANGSASAVAPSLFARLGCKVTFIHAEPNGRNINAACGSTHLESLLENLKKGDYDFGFAYDGDADRFMAYTHEGRLIDGDALIYLNALSLRKHQQLHQNKVVITVM